MAGTIIADVWRYLIEIEERIEMLSRNLLDGKAQEGDAARLAELQRVARRLREIYDEEA